MDNVIAMLRTKTTAVWGLLIATTLFSFWLGSDRGPSPRSAIPIIVLAFVKVRSHEQIGNRDPPDRYVPPRRGGIGTSSQQGPK